MSSKVAGMEDGDWNDGFGNKTNNKNNNQVDVDVDLNTFYFVAW
jgi:hypothetical protein